MKKDKFWQPKLRFDAIGIKRGIPRVDKRHNNVNNNTAL
jgi:hypothetical protein